MKKILGLLSIFFLVFIVSCSTDTTSPHERFDTYVKHWDEQKFDEMYKMLAAKSKETYSKEQFTDRYMKIYTDLDISNLEIKYKKLSDKQLKKGKKEGTAKLPFTVKMDSAAGPITFDYEATLLYEGKEDNKNWFIKWDQGFIFPELKDGGEVKIETEEPRRGEILDRNKMPLAINDTIWEVGIIPENLGSNAEQTKEKVADLLNISVDTVETALNADWVEPNLFVPLKKISKDNPNTDQLWELDGVVGNEVLGRVYPLNKATSHLVGYIGQINAEEMEKAEPGMYHPNDMIGKRGLEQLYEEKLKGEKGVKIFVVKKGEEDVILAEREVKDGETIQLTIDANIQEEVYKSYDDGAGTAAAIDPKTGETLALVSSPGFDPEKFLYGITQDQLDSLENDKQNPLLNRFSATYAPGSVMKPISAAIGLTNGSIKPGEGINIKGLTWGNEGWGDYKVRRVSESDGPVDLTDALVRSDNIYFAKKAVEMGNGAYTKGLKQFGFGEDLPYKYPITKSSISSNGKIENEVLLANTSYGQGEVEISALHMALTYTPILNKGDMLKPTLLLSEKTSKVWQEKLINEKQAKILQDALRKVVTEGTAKQAKMDGLAISGKTGTAELKKSSDEKGQENGWFVGYPTKDQDILIALMREHVEKKGGSGVAVEQVTDIIKNIKK
ncbi:penicillin-binding transpeptidase domain-containing protein [Virgibacillus alimentarius]|uniref:serine-type D-Ala-D-Ala carboxypeptidase n=1 Tax=Virgibacillus alimentarius TaxID=698769 RepID=A0ABS4S8Q0_9BACI|nr:MULTISPECIES: penicillin-binding transpeptidase domain-containing protein [Virgibacillus]MBP2256777.1 penicillin-binding protein [Virgibacillus alimentarius]HLR65646.1 penicillin-binding transpeptidase domain-containing protein [Virgibacillus sp.]